MDVCHFMVSEGRSGLVVDFKPRVELEPIQQLGGRREKGEEGGERRGKGERERRRGRRERREKREGERREKRETREKGEERREKREGREDEGERRGKGERMGGIIHASQRAANGIHTCLNKCPSGSRPTRLDR